MQYVERSIESKDWIIFLLVGCFVLLAIVSVLYKKRFEDFIKLPISNNFFIAKDKTDEMKHPFNIILFCIQIISISLFIYLFFPEENRLNFSLFIQIITGVFVFEIVKLMVEKMIGSIFSIDVFINQYVYQKLTYRNFLSLLIFAANLIFYFSFKPDLSMLLVFIGALVVFNGLIIFYSIKNYRTLFFSNFFYFILYLCTLEISPYIILYKALV